MDISHFCPTEIASDADEKTPYPTRNYLKNFTNMLFKWFSNNHIVPNAGKYHLLTSTSDEVSVKIENETIKNSSQEKLLGTVIDNLCKKKTHPLATIANCMDLGKKCSIINAFILHNSRTAHRYECFAVENVTTE